MNEKLCSVCGKPLKEHEIGFYNGVAGTHCMRQYASREYHIGEIATLRTIHRSLRYRAGQTEEAALESYAEIIQDKYVQALRMLERDFPWGVK